MDCDLDRKGEKNGNAKLTLEQAKEIRSAHARLMESLCETYGITRSHLQKIIKGARWGHLGGDN